MPRSGGRFGGNGSRPCGRLELCQAPDGFVNRLPSMRWIAHRELDPRQPVKHIAEVEAFGEQLLHLCRRARIKGRAVGRQLSDQCRWRSDG